MMRQGQNKKSRLQDAAKDVIHERGYERTRITDIAERAGVDAGSVYYYFKTKESFGTAVIDSLAKHYSALLEQAGLQPGPRKRINAFIQMVMDKRVLLAQHGCPVGGLCSELRKTAETVDLAQRASEVFREILDWLERQLRELGKAKDARILAEHVLCVLQGAALLAHSFDNPRHLQTQGRRLQRLILNL